MCSQERVSWLDAHYKDQLESAAGEQVMELPEDGNVEDYMETVLARHTVQISRLDRPLELMVIGDLCKWIRSQIILSRYERGLKGAKPNQTDVHLFDTYIKPMLEDGLSILSVG